VLVHELPESRLALHWRAQHGLAARLARQGWLSPPRDVASMISQLITENVVHDIRNLAKPQGDLKIQTHYDAAVQRVRSLL
jgi:hypothetical protein